MSANVPNFNPLSPIPISQPIPPVSIFLSLKNV